MFSPTSALFALWLVWLISWLLAAGWTTKTVVHKSAGSRLIYSVPTLLGAILLFRPPAGRLAIPLFRSVPSIAWIALVLAALGFGLTWWARIKIGRLWSGTVTLKAGHTIVRSGPYALTRHPIYTGLFLAVLATALVQNSLSALIGVGFIMLGLILKLRQEEQILQDRFGAAYLTYKKEVPALIPGVW